MPTAFYKIQRNSSKSGSQSSTRDVPKSRSPIARPKHGTARWWACPSQPGLTTKAHRSPGKRHGTAHFFVRPQRPVCVCQCVSKSRRQFPYIYIYTHLYTYKNIYIIYIFIYLCMYVCIPIPVASATVAAQPLESRPHSQQPLIYLASAPHRRLLGSSSPDLPSARRHHHPAKSSSRPVATPRQTPPPPRLVKLPAPGCGLAWPAGRAAGPAWRGKRPGVPCPGLGWATHIAIYKQHHIFE